VAGARDVNHFPERVFEYCKHELSHYLGNKSVRRAADDIRRSDPTLELIERVASASKHHLIKRKNVEGKEVEFSASGQFRVVHDEMWICDEVDRPTHNARAVIDMAIRYWRRWLAEHPGT
jgi:hypothetical protein